MKINIKVTKTNIKLGICRCWTEITKQVTQAPDLKKNQRILKKAHS